MNTRLADTARAAGPARAADTGVPPEPSRDPRDPRDAALDELIGPDATRPWWRRPSTWIGLVLLLAVAAGVAVWSMQRQAAAAPQYVTTPIVRGDLALSVGATGTLQPTRQVAVGSELSGTVARVLVDVNDAVKKGQLLVQLDTAKLADQITRSRAALATAQATVAQARATLAEVRATLARQEQVSQLSGGRVPAASELDASRAAVERAVAELASAEAGVAQARAQLSTDETNLAKASIRSPIDGVVLARAVEPGQAVAASLQAVTLLTLAEDLKRMQLSVAVDEADVGTLQPGQTARFTVSAYPNRDWPATVRRVAYGSTTTDNVVTYTTLLDVDNTDGALRPGMTANATIRTAGREGVLLVPGTALRFTPVGDGVAGGPAGGGARPGAGGPAAPSGGIVGAMMPRPPSAARRAATGGGSPGGAGATSGPRRLWVLKDGAPVAIPVTVGATDGRRTEVSGPGLVEGLPVITEQRAGKPS